MSLRKCRIAIALVWTAAALLFLVNYAATALSADETVQEVKDYRKWTKVNPEPQLMPSQVAIDCVAPLPPSPAPDFNASPHSDRYFTVYVNDTGRDAMLKQQNPNFPEGSVIVKEKLSSKKSSTPELLTVMIKRARGFNPDGGDWEFMVLDGTGTKVEGRGNLQNCHRCHIDKRKSDYVFRTYLSYEDWNNMR